MREHTWDPRRIHHQLDLALTPARLADEHGLDRRDGSMLCSLAGDLTIIEIVDMGMWNVAMTMPLGMFTTSRTGGA